MTLSNAITLARLASVPFAFRAILVEQWGVACALFWLAVATDLVDGRIARARGESSTFGGLLDHATDALFVSTALAGLAMGGRIPFFLPVLVVVAFFQYVLDSRTLAGRPLRASAVGRWNGVCYFVPVGVVVTREALGLSQPSDFLVAGLAWILVATTLLSIADRALSLIALRRGPRSGSPTS
jgi:phosphatidylglycerophosphate synthase